MIGRGKKPPPEPMNLAGAGEAPAEVIKTQEKHAFRFAALGFSGNLSSSGSPVVGSIFGYLILIAVVDGTGFLIAELANRYALHPAVAIPLVLGVALLVLWTGVRLIRGAAPASSVRAGAAPGQPESKKAPKKKGRRGFSRSADAGHQ